MPRAATEGSIAPLDPPRGMFVLDPNVLVAATRSKRGASYQLLRALRHGTLDIGVSTAVLFEYEDVLLREEHRRASGLSGEDIRDILALVARRAKRVTIRYGLRPSLPDPDDVKILGCAFNGMASAMVTFNRRDFPMYGRPTASRSSGRRRLTSGSGVQGSGCSDARVSNRAVG